MTSDKLDLEEEMGIVAPEAALASEFHVTRKAFLGVAVVGLAVLVFARAVGML